MTTKPAGFLKTPLANGDIQALPLVASSACLLGDAVRYDGTDKFHHTVDELIRPYVRLEGVCPEVGAGMGIPRPPIRLVDDGDGFRAIGVEDPNFEVTASLRQFAEETCKRIGADWPLCGYILKSRSPSCGIFSTPRETRGEITPGSGLHVEEIARQHPWLPLAEDDELAERQRCLEFLWECYICAELMWGYRQTGIRQVIFNSWPELRELANSEDRNLLEVRTALMLEVRSRWRSATPDDRQRLLAAG